LGDPPPDGFGGPLDRRLAQSDAGALVEQFRPLLEAVGDGSAEGGQSLGGRREAALGYPDAAVPGAGAFAADPAVVVGAVARDRPAERLDRLVAVPVERGAPVAVGAVDGAGGVAGFWGRCSW
jgi:hypothetical protein